MTALVAIASGCINLPPALEQELECPAADQPDNFGSHVSCMSSAPRHSR
jgi:hypothetical protein